MKDYSEYLKQPGRLAWIEEQWQIFPVTHYFHAHIVNEAMKTYHLKRISEIGCGSGEVAKLLKDCIYLGYDANEKCIEIAKNKNPELMFMIADIRELGVSYRVDLIICFGFLKHFGLHEWSTIFEKISSFGEYFIFDMPIGETKDDGTEFHHVWKAYSDIHEDIEWSGFEVLKEIPINKDEICFITKRK